MNKAVFLLSGLFALCLPSANAQEGKTPLKFTIGEAFAKPQSDFSTDKLNGPVKLVNADPTALSGNALNMTAAPFNPTGRNKQWLMKDQQETFSVGSNFVIGDNENIDRRIMIAPRFTKVQSNNAGLESFSAEIRLGSVVQFDRTSAKKGWYVFAAADGEALSIATNSLRMGDGSPMAVSLSDQITVGDLQAGISTYVGDTQLTISYIQTEAEYAAQGSETISKTESFAGISLAKSF